MMMMRVEKKKVSDVLKKKKKKTNLLFFFSLSPKLIQTTTTTTTEQANIKAKNNGGLPPPADAKAVHVLSSCLKAGATWTRVRAQQDAREACGGMGFLAANRIGVYKADQDVDVTFEGDNTVRGNEGERVFFCSRGEERERKERRRKKEKTHFFLLKKIAKKTQ